VSLAEGKRAAAAGEWKEIKDFADCTARPKLRLVHRCVCVMVVVGCGSIKSKTLAGLSLEVGASGVATDKKKGSPKLKGKSPQKKGGSGGQKGTCVDGTVNSDPSIVISLLLLPYKGHIKVMICPHMVTIWPCVVMTIR